MAGYKENTFSLALSGEIRSGCSRRQVIRKTATILAVDPDRAADFFNGAEVVVQEDLDLVTAVRRRNLLEKSGAAARVRAMAPCAECDTVGVWHEPCPDCGFVPESEGTPSERAYPRPEELPEAPEEIKLRRRAVRGILIGTALFGAAFFLDHLARKVLWDIWWIYAAGLVPFVIGCMNYSELKGYSPAVGLLGAGLMGGVGVLLLLPDRRGRDGPERVPRREKTVAVFLIAGTVLWGWQEYTEWKSVNDFLDDARRLETVRRSPGFADHFRDQSMAMETLIDKGFALLEEEGLRPDRYMRVVDTLFESAARFIIDMRHHAFVRNRERGPVDPRFSVVGIREHRRVIHEYLEQKAKALRDFRFDYLFRLWKKQMYGADYPGRNLIDPKLAGFIRLVTRNLAKARAIMRSGTSSHSREGPKEWREEGADGAVSVTISGDGVATLKVGEGPFGLDGRDASFILCGKCRRKFQRTGGDFPDKYLGWYAVYSSFTPRIINLREGYHVIKTLLPGRL